MYTDIIILSFVQAFTEFLPVSSSGHLVIVKQILGNNDLGVQFDVALHMGTLLAVMGYFHADVKGAIIGLIDICRNRSGHNKDLALTLIISALPTFVFGSILVFSGLLDSVRNIQVIIFNLAFFAIILFFADKRPIKDGPLTPLKALILGCAQMIALIPGVSRSGVTISMARFLGLNRASAARISMLMLLPVVSAGFLYLSLELISVGHFDIKVFALGIALSFIFGLGFINFFMKYIQKYTFNIFVGYRLVLAALLLIFFV